MAYDLHIVRTEDWVQAATAPVTRADVDYLIAADAELAWSASDYVDLRNNAGVTTRYFMITWNGDACFYWYQDQIICSGPDDAQVLKLASMAQNLNAYLVGDDGEQY